MPIYMLGNKEKGFVLLKPNKCICQPAIITFTKEKEKATIFHFKDNAQKMKHTIQSENETLKLHLIKQEVRRRDAKAN